MGGRAALFASIVLAFAGVSSTAAAAPEKCQIGWFAQLPVTMVGMRARVPVKINGVSLPFTVDSGSFFSIMNRETVSRLKLPTQMAPFGYYIRGAGGSDNRVDVATVHSFDLEGLAIPDVKFLALPSVEPGSAGLLGQNVLSLFDTEYDLNNGVIRLMKPSSGCAHAMVAYWAGDKFVGEVSVQPITPEQRHLRGEAKINGQTVRVIFDTGASSSVLRLSSAQRLGFRVDGPGVEARGPARGIGPRAAEVWVAPFDSVDIGGEKIEHTQLQVASIDLDDADMLLGADFFLSHRVYVSKQQRKIYFTYNGGPVFHLTPRTQQAASAPPPAAAAGGPPAAGPETPPPPPAADQFADTPTDAAGYIRRGEASMSRRDYAAALTDFDKAVQLDPKTPRNFVERARARIALRQPVFAMNDFNAALAINPAAPGALIGRGQLYLISRDLPHAQADFDAAVKADPNLVMTVGQIYANAGRFQPAIADYDAWISAHADAEHIADALGARCRVRVLWGQELDKALADCDAALRKGPRTANLLETRGLARLRRGELDPAIADFDLALKLQPKLAWALYGRGLARAGKGDKAGSDADLQAATAIAPNLPAQMKRYGIGQPGATAPATAG
jgi:tetratricopeptide (TPR) repeat protein/predicted aspartyl protease